MKEILYVQKMTDAEFNLFSKLIYSNLGIMMPFKKKLMLESRLTKRLNAVGLNSFIDYYNLITDSISNNEEYNIMVNAVTTNKTDFFREPSHFDYLIGTVLPEFLRKNILSEYRKLKVWSAGCSTGNEVYTLGMVLEEFFLKYGMYDFTILGTDISNNVLSRARSGIYSSEIVTPIHISYKKKYLMVGKGSKKGYYKIVPELMQKVKFEKLNFMDSNYKIKEKMDIIFCRNVVIYFDKQTKINIFNKLYEQLNFGGYLFIGSSETLNGINNKFKSVGPSIYKKIS